jgi:putative ABC transport system permease protein
MNKLFGFEGVLAKRSLKRNKRNFRATVIALTISIILIIAGGSIGVQVGKMTSLMYPNVDADVMIEQVSSVYSYGGGLNPDLDPSGVQYMSLEAAAAEEITAKLREYPNTEVFAVGDNSFLYSATVPKDMLTPEMQWAEEDEAKYVESLYSSVALEGGDVNESETSNPFASQLKPGEHKLSLALVTTDAMHYAELCEKAGVPQGSNILLNHYQYLSMNDRKVSEFKPLKFSGQELFLTDMAGETLKLPLQGELGIGEIPDEVMYAISGYTRVGGSALSVLVPAVSATPSSVDVGTISYYWFASTKDRTGFMQYAEGFIHDQAATGQKIVNKGNAAYFAAMESEPDQFADSDGWVQVTVQDLDVLMKRMRNMSTLIMLPIYGFVGVLTLIALTNVISTISTNVRSRSREFAALRSTGMTQGSLTRMLSLESGLCSLRALLIGLPLGIICSYVIYLFVALTAGFGYELPLLPIVVCVLGVLAVMWLTTWFSARRLRGGSVVDTLRTNDGM